MLFKLVIYIVTIKSWLLVLPRIQSKDGSTTEVNADIPGVKVLTKEDGSVSVSLVLP